MNNFYINRCYKVTKYDQFVKEIRLIDVYNGAFNGAIIL